MSVTAHDNIAVCNTLCDGPDTKYTIIVITIGYIIDGQIHIMCRSVSSWYYMHYTDFSSSMVFPLKQGKPVSNISVTIATTWSWYGRMDRNP